jgi:hypothetical protein
MKLPAFTKTLRTPEFVLSYLLGAAVALFVVVGCGTFGSNPSPPTSVERALFNTVTNYVVQTNLVQVAVPVFHTNEVVQTVTNTVPGGPTQVLTVTNTVVQTNYVQTPTEVVTNVPTYTMTAKPGTTSSIQAGSGILNTFFPGAGSLIGYGLTALVGAWGYFRSSKLGDTSGALTQEMETVLEFLGAMPNGPQYVNTLKSWLQAHQNETGVATQVLAMLSNEVSNPDAKVAAQQLINTINALNAQTAPSPTAPAQIPPVKLV